jgi:hypothetical protein
MFMTMDDQTTNGASATEVHFNGQDGMVNKEETQMDVMESSRNVLFPYL